MSEFDVDDKVTFNFSLKCNKDLIEGLNGKKGKILSKRNVSLMVGEFNYAYIVQFEGFYFKGDRAVEVNESYLMPYQDNLKNGTKVVIRDGLYMCTGVIIGKVWNDNKDQKYAIFYNNPRPNGLQITIQDRSEFMGVILDEY